MNRRLAEKTDSLLKKERGAVFKEPGGRVSICLAYPNTYYVGMSNLGFQGIYALLNRRDDVVCERVFLPDSIDMPEYLRTGTSLFSMESKRALVDFDIVAFSLSFENDYPNIARMLRMSRIPFKAAERNAYHPLLIAGGVCASFNPEPIAPCFDVIFVGEAEETLEKFIDEFVKSTNRRDAIDRAISISGAYAPSRYEVEYEDSGAIKRRIAIKGAPDIIKKSFVTEISRTPFATIVLTPETEFADMSLIEVMRGCPWRCRFCIVGNFLGPLRMKSPFQVKSEIEEGKKRSRKIGLIGPSLADYKDLGELLDEEGVRFSITSLRAGGRSAELIAHMKDHKSVSIAPEAGSERLRKAINKQITEDDILKTVELLNETDIETLRLYFMVGLPTETDEDIESMIDLCMKIKRMSGAFKIALSLSPFVPKPFTPFQWSPMAELGLLKARMKTVKKKLGREGIRIFHDTPKQAHQQGLFSIGDRRIFGVIEEMADCDDYAEACRIAGVDPAFYIFREKKPDENLPWDFIDAGVDKEWLWSEYKKAIGF